jgi:hypothetical protein
MDNLNNNLSDEAQSQPSFLAAVSGSLLTDDYIRKIADEYANQYYSKDANPISHESLTEPFIDGFKKAMELLSNDR